MGERSEAEGGEGGCPLLSLLPCWAAAGQVHGLLPSLLDLLPPCSFSSSRSPSNASPGAPYHLSFSPAPPTPLSSRPSSSLSLVKCPAVVSRFMQALISIKVGVHLDIQPWGQGLESDCEGSTEEACRGVLDRVIPPLMPRRAKCP